MTVKILMVFYRIGLVLAGILAGAFVLAAILSRGFFS
jgi:hypothetical protein